MKSYTICYWIEYWLSLTAWNISCPNIYSATTWHWRAEYISNVAYLIVPCRACLLPIHSLLCKRSESSARARTKSSTLLCTSLHNLYERVEYATFLFSCWGELVLLSQDVMVFNYNILYTKLIRLQCILKYRKHQTFIVGRKMRFRVVYMKNLVHL